MFVRCVLAYDMIPLCVVCCVPSAASHRSRWFCRGTSSTWAGRVHMKYCMFTVTSSCRVPSVYASWDNVPTSLQCFGVRLNTARN